MPISPPSGAVHTARGLKRSASLPQWTDTLIKQARMTRACTYLETAPTAHFLTLDPDKKHNKLFTCNERRRTRVAKYIDGLCKEFNCTSETNGYAMNYFDRTMAAHLQKNGGVQLNQIATEDLQVHAGTCVMIAAKFIGTEDRFPRPIDLCETHNDDPRLDPQVFVNRERELLDELKWELNLVTPSHYFEIFRSACPEAPLPYSMLPMVQKHADAAAHNHRLLRYPFEVTTLAAIQLAWEDQPRAVEEKEEGERRYGLEIATATHLDWWEVDECVREMRFFGKHSDG